MSWQRPPSDRCLSNLAIDRLLVGEIEDGGRTSALEHMASCSRCGARYRQLEAERSEFSAASPPFSPPAAPPAPARRPRVRAVALGAAGALATAAMVLVLCRPVPPSSPVDHVRAKGGIRLGFYLKRGERVIEGRSGDSTHPGDAVRFTYTAFTPGYLMVVSRDGSGHVSAYYPDAGEAAPVGAAEGELLPGSIILDDVLGREVVYGILCAAPVPVARAVEAVERSADDPSLSIAGCTTDRLILEKSP
jgi:hypothetical protein